MEKEAVVKELQKRGYDTKLESSVVIVSYSSDKKADMEEIRIILKEIGYEGSFGIRGKKTSEQNVSVTSFAESQNGQMEFEF